MAKSSSSRMVDIDHLEDDKLFSRLLSKKKYNPSKHGESSFRVLYYAGATGSVPFTWESQPGTPKHKLGDHPPPPLTPPPQHQAFSPLLKKHHSKNSKIFNSILRKAPSKKVNASPLFSPPPSSSSSSFSSSYSLPSTPFHDGFKARSRSIVYARSEEDEDEHESRSPTSTLCFGPRNGSPLRKFKGYSSPMKSVKKVVMSFVGHANSN